MLTAINPADGQTIRTVETDSKDAVDAKIGQAVEAYHKWRRCSFAERGDVLLAVAGHMRDNARELGRFMTEEMGKPVREADGEVNKAAWAAEHYAMHAEQYLADDIIVSDATRSWVQYTPLGPVVGILPWNAPFWLAFRYCAPALMAGNTCLMKHDPHVPGCAKAIEKVFEAVGAPKGIFQALYLETPQVEAVLRDRRVRAISFTGSVRGGAAVGAIAGEEIKPCVLELGGSDPAIVLADADLDAAVHDITTMRIINAGQSCIAAKRLLVESAVYEPFVDKLHASLAALKVGDPTDPETDLGPLARADLRDELHKQVAKTVEQGGTCRMGGEIPDGPGFFYPVTLLTDLKRTMTANCEETFGPVAAVTRVSSAEEALDIANDSEYGLAGSIWTTPDRGVLLARDLETGQVAVNGVVKTDPRLPSGGIKRSGVGRELGPHGIKEFTNAQQIWVGPKRG